MQNLKQSDFKKEVLDYPGVVVADFYADWCGPCRMLSPLMEELDHENKEKNVKYVKVNVDENQSLAGEYQVMSIPTVLFFKKGKVVKQKVGVDAKYNYLLAVQEALKV